MTSRGLTLVVGAALLVLVGRLLGVAELYVVGAATGALVLASVLATRLASATVAARRLVANPRLPAGARGEVVLELRNDSRLPATLLLVEDRCHPSLAEVPRFVVPGLRPGRTVSLPYEIRGSVRGRYRVGPVALRVRDPFGLAERVRTYTQTADVLVYPRIEALSAGPLRGLHRGSGSSDRRRVYAAGDEFYTMREYVQGDDLRQVHWPSTAHRQTLMVRQQEMPWQAQATVFCDTRARAHSGVGEQSTLEKSVSAAASVLWHLSGRGYALRFGTDQQAALPPAESFGVLIERLAELRAGEAAGLAAVLDRLPVGGEGLFVALLAPPPGEGALTASPDVRALVRAGRSHAARLALVTYDPARGLGAERAHGLVRVLVARGWRAAAVAVDAPVADAWDLLGQRRPRLGWGATAAAGATAVGGATAAGAGA